MYCVKCGVRLEDTEKQCPLCLTRVYHPDIEMPDSPPTFPEGTVTEQRLKPFVPAVVMLVAFILPMLVTVITDLKLNETLSWSVYVIGALVIGYLIVGLPLWFEHPNPVIFAPPVFAAIIVFLLVIDLMTGGGWFMCFAFPVSGAISLISIAVITLSRYLPRAKLYIAGGAIMAFSALMPLIEFLLVTYLSVEFVAWSIYPLIVGLLLGGLCIFIRASRPVREAAERKFFF